MQQGRARAWRAGGALLLIFSGLFYVCFHTVVYTLLLALPDKTKTLVARWLPGVMSS